MSWKIYTISVEGELRYVGQTKDSLCKRLNRHLNPHKDWHFFAANLFRKCKRNRDVRIQLLQEFESPADQHGNKYSSGTQAARQLGLHQAAVNRVLLGKQKQTGGFFFEFVWG